MISCRNLNGGFRSNLSVSAGFLINFPRESCVRFIVISLTSAILSQNKTKKRTEIFLIFLSLNAKCDLCENESARPDIEIVHAIVGVLFPFDVTFKHSYPWQSVRQLKPTHN